MPERPIKVRVSERSLRQTVTAVFEKMGESPEGAAEAADVMVSTDLRGVTIQGVTNLLRGYVKAYNEGHLNPRPNWRVIRETPATAVVDADRGLVPVFGGEIMKLAMEKAAKTGMGIVTMYNCGDSGAIGHHAMLAARQNMIGMCASASGPMVLPTNGAEPRFGTNPIAVAAPARNQPPVLFDIATSAIAGGTPGLALRDGVGLPPGTIAELDGTPVMEEMPPREKGQYYLLPLGSVRERGSHKGYGFALLAEILSTMLSGQLPAMVDPDGGGKMYMAAYNIEAFTSVGDFKDNMDLMLKTLRGTKPAAGQDRVMYPGLGAYETEQERRVNGIPLHEEVIEWFNIITDELSIPPLKIS